MILNITQHKATKEQIADGIVQPSADDKVTIERILTFDKITNCTQESIEDRADKLVAICKEYKADGALIAGAPWLMSLLEKKLMFACVKSYYAFSERVCEEKVVDGKTITTRTFKYGGLVEGRRV